MKENIISGGLFEEYGAGPLVPGPISKRRTKIPLSEYTRFIKATALKEAPIMELWPQGLWEFLGNHGKAPRAFIQYVVDRAQLAADTDIQKFDEVNKRYVQDWSRKASIFRSAVLKDRDYARD